MWDFVDDLLEAGGGWVGVILGFGLPLVAVALSVYVIVRGG